MVAGAVWYATGYLYSLYTAAEHRPRPNALTFGLASYTPRRRPGNLTGHKAIRNVVARRGGATIAAAIAAAIAPPLPATALRLR